MNKEECIWVIRNLGHFYGVNSTILENVFWIINNLKEENLPDEIKTNSKKYVILNFNNKMEIEVTHNSVYYIQFTGYNGGDRYRRYLFTPNGSLGARDIFYLNAEIEYIRKNC